MKTHPYVYCFLRPFLAHRMFFVQNKCLQWIQHHDKPLVRPLRSSLNTQKKMIILGIFLLYRKSMGAQLDLAAVATPKVADSGALAKSLEQALGYICAKFRALSQNCTRLAFAPLKSPHYET